MPIKYWITILSFTGTMVAWTDNIGTDSGSKYAWGENIGWVNAGSSNNDVSVHFDGQEGWVSGYLWSENIGWIKLGNDSGGPYANNDETNWGVDLDESGNLSGYGWGENIGWINFNHAHCDASINLSSGEFSGHAWGENVGWLKFKGASPDYGIRSLAFDTQAEGTPNWWLDNHGVMESYDEGDGVSAWEEYVMDTDPNDDTSYLQITNINIGEDYTDITFLPSSASRYYTLTKTESLTSGEWTHVVGQVGIAGLNGNQTMQDTNSHELTFYSMKVTLSP